MGIIRENGFLKAVWEVNSLGSKAKSNGPFQILPANYDGCGEIGADKRIIGGMMARKDQYSFFNRD